MLKTSQNFVLYETFAIIFSYDTFAMIFSYTLKYAVDFHRATYISAGAQTPCFIWFQIKLVKHPITNILIVFFKEDMTKICFVNFYQSKTTINQNKETTVSSYWKMSNQNTKKSPGIEFALFNCTGEMGMDNFGYLNS